MDSNVFTSTYYMDTKSAAYARTLSDCRRVAVSNANVLLIGESGVGKDVAAQYIHALSRRSDKAFVAVNCNAYTESLLEPELFGMEPGIFSDTIRRRIGKFELADVLICLWAVFGSGFGIAAVILQGLDSLLNRFLR